MAGRSITRRGCVMDIADRVAIVTGGGMRRLQARLSGRP